jgi:cobalt-zinc-cadmium efflux system protein
MNPGHDHGDMHRPAGSAASGHRRRLRWALVVIGGFFVAELVGALISGSLALLGDAGHMLTDVVGLGLALAAIEAAARTRGHPQRTFGLYRLEVLAALVNAVLLAGLAGYVLYEAVQRFGDPPEVAAVPMLVVAAAGLAANVVAVVLLHSGAKESLNLEGAFLEVVADAVSSVGVLVAAAVMLLTGWPYADPIVAVAIGLWVLPRALRLGARSVRVLVQAAPDDVRPVEVHGALADIEGVVDVHDLHVWTLTSGMEVVSAHVMVAAGVDSHAVLDRARGLLTERYGVEHATLQVEPDDHSGCEQVTW